MIPKIKEDQGRSRKLHINFPIFTLLERGPTLVFSRELSKESKRMLLVPERSVGGV